MSKLLKFLLAAFIVSAMLACTISVNVPTPTGAPVPVATTAAPPTPLPTTAVPPHSDWLTYTDAAYNFQFKYPPDSTLSSKTDTSGRIELSITPGTNLGEKFLEVSASEYAVPCGSPHAAGYAVGTIAFHHETLNGIDFLVESAGDAGAGNIYEWTGYTAEKTPNCVSLTFILHSTNPGMYEVPPPVFDSAAESAIFAEIVSTFTWLTP